LVPTARTTAAAKCFQIAQRINDEINEGLNENGDEI
jgi:hypothetical protein